MKDQNASIHKYKYHVESPATQNKYIKSLEFITGPKTSGGIIDRYLAVDRELKPECKWHIYYVHIHKSVAMTFVAINMAM